MICDDLIHQNKFIITKFTPNFISEAIIDKIILT